MRRIIPLLVAMILCAFTSVAQNIKGNVKDENGKSIANASVSLLNAKDSSVVKLAVTEQYEQYQFKNIKEGRYMTNISYVGYKAAYSAVFELSGSGEANAASVTLTKLSGDLKNVTVTATKPVIEVKADKTILHVENSINAVGNDALELLRKSPGVLVDKDENLSLSGKNGVKVYVDGKPSPLSGSNLAYYHKSLQSSQIEAIEIITNPSAKYEAEGNAGIINIRLKKNKSFGTNGSVNAGYNISIYPKYNAGFSLNHRNAKVNLFANYNYNKTHNEAFMNLYRVQLDTLFDQHTTMTFRNKSHGFKAGMDYFINNRNTIGVMVNGNLADISFANLSRTAISYKPTGVVDRILVANNKNVSTRDNVNTNLNYRFADTSGHELNVDADYGYYKIKGNQYQPNFYFDPTGTTLTDQYIYNMIAPTKIDIYSAKTDYEQNYKKGRLGIGGKVSYVKTTNNFDRYNVYNNGKFLDTLRSNDFNYKENINAIYVNYNRQFKGIMEQAGVRVENTHLRPQYTNNISVTNTLNYKLTTRLSYSHVNDVFSQIVDTAEKSKSFISKKNLVDQD